MEIGKVPSDILEKLILEPIKNKNSKRSEVLVRPSIGEDCSLLSISGENIVLSTDPITGTDKGIGKLAVNINVNDIVSSGAEPIALMLTILLPKNSTEKILKNIINEIYLETNKLNLEVIGGHTEVTDAVNRPVISCTIIGKTINKKFIKTADAKAGQSIIMTKWAGIEGTNIIINENEDKLRKILDHEEICEAKNLSEFLSVAKEAEIARKLEISCMHDATEGGVIGACLEIAKASNTGIKIFQDEIPILNSTKKICKYFKINPYKLISSGVLLMTTFSPKKLIQKLGENDVDAKVIGEITKNSEDRHIYLGGAEKERIIESVDELYKVIKI